MTLNSKFKLLVFITCLLSISKTGESMFGAVKVNRSPAVLGPPTAKPTGENAEWYSYLDEIGR